MQEDVLLDSSSSDLIVAADTRPISTWDEGKKREFIDTFKKRTDVALYLLKNTANYITEKATNRRFISQKHYKDIKTVYPVYFDMKNTGWNPPSISGRSTTELEQIAENRADDVIKKLPALKTAVKIIDTETYALIEKHAAAKNALQVKKDKLDELAEEINLGELDQTMTVGALRAMLKKIEKTRDTLLHEISAEGRELQEMDILISKKLYAGIPGISEAIVKVINEHYERITALQAMTRRVEERIQFGDSKEALDMLAHFESDESTVSDNIRAEFDAALEKLKVFKVKRLASKKK
jgi:hypothetical protein